MIQLIKEILAFTLALAAGALASWVVVQVLYLIRDYAVY